MVTRKSACVHCVAVYTVKVICWVAPTGRNDPVIEVSVTPEGSSKSKRALFTIYNYRDLIFQCPSDPQRSHSGRTHAHNAPWLITRDPSLETVSQACGILNTLKDGKPLAFEDLVVQDQTL